VKFSGFVGPSYTLRSINIDSQRCVNLYPETIESGKGKEGSVMSLQSAPGLTVLTTVGSGPIRGVHATAGGQLYVVSSNKLYEISSSWVATEVGTLITSGGDVSMDDNGTTLMIVDGDNGYFNAMATNTFAQITDADFPGADTVEFQDGYFIYNYPDSTGKFGISSLNATDPTDSFSALDFATAEGSPDAIVGLISDHRDLYVFGSRTTEVYFNSGNADFPFERQQGAFIEHGCAATFSIAKMNNAVFWLGEDEYGDGIVYKAKGYEPQRISTHAVEEAIRGYASISDAKAFAYQQAGHYFYVINFTGANTTWVYDDTTGMWHERTHFTNGEEQRYRADNHAFAYNVHIAGDYFNSNLYKLDLDVFTDNGGELIRERRTPHVSGGLNYIFHHKMQVDMEVGVGIDGSGQGDDPLIMMQFSDDGGLTWSNEKQASIGKIGERKVRAIWRRLGRARDRVYRVRISDPVKVAIIGAELDVSKGES